MWKVEEPQGDTLLSVTEVENFQNVSFFLFYWSLIAPFSFLVALLKIMDEMIFSLFKWCYFLFLVLFFVLMLHGSFED